MIFPRALLPLLRSFKLNKDAFIQCFVRTLASIHDLISRYLIEVIPLNVNRRRYAILHRTSKVCSWIHMRQKYVCKNLLSNIPSSFFLCSWYILVVALTKRFINFKHTTLPLLPVCNN